MTDDVPENDNDDQYVEESLPVGPQRNPIWYADKDNDLANNIPQFLGEVSYNFSEQNNQGESPLYFFLKLIY